MSREHLQELARNGNLVITTKYGEVDLSSTASVWGEGPNVDGYRWARGEYTPMSGNEADELFGWPISAAAEGWAEENSSYVVLQPIHLGKGQEGQRRKEALESLAVEAGHFWGGQPSIGRWLVALADERLRSGQE